MEAQEVLMYLKKEKKKNDKAAKENFKRTTLFAPGTV